MTSGATVPTITYPISSKTTPKQIYTGTADTVQIINTSLTDTVWVGGSSNVTSTGQGGAIPVYPSTQLAWSRTNVDTGLWAIHDATGTATVALIVTDSVEWQPNPIAISTAIATNLVTSGVVTQDRPEVIAFWSTTLPFNNPVVDTSKYLSLDLAVATSMVPTPSTTDTFAIRLLWQSANGFGGAVDNLWHTFGQQTINHLTNWRIPVKGTQMFLIQSVPYALSSGTATLAASLTGSFRSVDALEVTSAVDSPSSANVATWINSAQGGDGMVFRFRGNMTIAQVIGDWTFPSTGRHLITIKSVAGGGNVSVRRVDDQFSTQEVALFPIAATQASFELDFVNGPYFIQITNGGTATFVNITINRG